MIPANGFEIHYWIESDTFKGTVSQPVIAFAADGTPLVAGSGGLVPPDQSVPYLGHPGDLAGWTLEPLQ